MDSVTADFSSHCRAAVEFATGRPVAVACFRETVDTTRTVTDDEISLWRFIFQVNYFFIRLVHTPVAVFSK